MSDPTLTENDRRTLESVRDACDEWDAFIPHAIAQNTGVRRLVAIGLVAVGDGLFFQCESCDSGHESIGYVLTEAGKRTLESGDGHE